MTIFGYGSLLSEDSFRNTVPEANLLSIEKLKGYKRVFDIKSPYRKDHETGIFSCVLNLAKDAKFTVFGALYEIPESAFQILCKREKGYDSAEILLESDINAATFIARNYEPYDFVQNNKAQDEYLTLCLVTAENYGKDFLNNFLDSTFIGKSTLRDWLNK